MIEFDFKDPFIVFPLVTAVFLVTGLVLCVLKWIGFSLSWCWPGIFGCTGLLLLGLMALIIILSINAMKGD